MNRINFLKALSISILSPTIITALPKIKKQEALTGHLKLNNWPIYPQQYQWSYGSIDHKTGEAIITTNILTYVKINRDGNDYLVAVRESGISEASQISEDKTQKRFDFFVKQVQDKYEVSQYMVDVGHVIKYDKNIHN